MSLTEKETIAALVKLYAEEESISEEVKQIKSDAKEAGFNPSILSAVAKSIVKNNVDSLIEKSEDIIRVVEVSRN